MSNLEKNRRRNQIIAERAVDKVLSGVPTAPLASNQHLYAQVEKALESALHTQRWMGHPQKAVEVAYALIALRELKLRGTQLQLPL